jgi:hypothetical protein
MQMKSKNIKKYQANHDIYQCVTLIT